MDQEFVTTPVKEKKKPIDESADSAIDLSLPSPCISTDSFDLTEGAAPSTPRPSRTWTEAELEAPRIKVQRRNIRVCQRASKMAHGLEHHPKICRVLGKEFVE